MRLPGLKFLTDKWVLGGILAGAAIYWFTNKSHHAYVAKYDTSSMHFPDYDKPGLYEIPSGPEHSFNNLRFSGSAELQRRLTIT